MDMHGSGDDFSSVDAGRQQKSLLAQLLRAALAMDQIDQLLRWLADNIVQRFNIQLIQFWASHMDATGLMALQLRTQARLDSTLPEQIVVNNDLALIAQRMTGGQRIYAAQPVEILFSQYRATLLRRYGLNYCTGSFMDAPGLLLPAPGTQGGIASPFAMTTLIFTYQPPQPNLMASINGIVNQAITLAGNKGMLQPIAPGQQVTPIGPLRQAITTEPLRQETIPLTELIPRRRQDTDIMLLNNPFSSSAVVADKRARRIYTAIDGRANIAALCRNTGMNLKEAYAALRILLQQKRIDFYEPGGQLVDTAVLPDNF